MGRPNKLTANVKGMILAALDKAGAEDYLLKQANENPSAFMTLLGKVLPLQVAGAENGPIEINVITGVQRSGDFLTCSRESRTE